jgi:hypothetical protein
VLTLWLATGLLASAPASSSEEVPPTYYGPGAYKYDLAIERERLERLQKVVAKAVSKPTKANVTQAVETALESVEPLPDTSGLLQAVHRIEAAVVALETRAELQARMRTLETALAAVIARIEREEQDEDDALALLFA